MIRRLFLLAFVVALAGCGGRATEQAAAPAQRLVRVDWYGAQCFRIKSSLGISILTNPFAPGTTAFSQPGNMQPEILLVTSEESDVNYVDMTTNTPHILRGSVGIGTNTASGIPILGIPMYADAEGRNIAGLDVIYRWSMDGLKFCFLGKLDRLPAPQELSKIGRVDVLFVPVNGSNLSSADRTAIIRALAPQVIIPMGNTPAMQRFASGYTSVYRLNRAAALLSRAALPAQPTVLLFPAP